MTIKQARRLQALKEDKETFGLTSAEESELRILEFLSKHPDRYKNSNPCGEISFGPSSECVLTDPEDKE